MNRKGFTLVELLAVIVIIGVIALIATPLILGVIDSAKKSSFNNSAHGLMKAADTSFNNTRLIETPTETKYTFSNGVETKESGNVTLLYNGEKPKNGIFIINTDGQVAMAVHDGKYCASKYFTDDQVTVEEKVLAECEITLTEAPIPILAQGLIPVYYDDINMVWKKADVNNPNGSWYNYTNFKWANAVTVTETNRSTYMNAAVGTTIPMADINTMFVWIPRYKYRIPTGTGPREIEVKFQLNTAKSTGDAITTYYTHPAFTFGGKELDGIWVGKFEITGSIADITIKPDSIAVRSQGNRSFFEAIRTMDGNSKYGFSTDSDTHMIKNTEWGVVAYLSHSKYGKYGNPDYSGANKEVYINNSSSYYTGRSRGEPPINVYTTSNGFYTYDGKCAYILASLPAPCNTGAIGQILPDKKLSYGASTTGTIYGIYDMSGGAFEDVMGMYYPTTIPATGIRDCSGYSTNYPPETCPTSSPYSSQYDLFNIANNDYYNKYLSTTIATGYIKGDATYETSGWYGDFNTNVTLILPWHARSGSQIYGPPSGIFGYVNATGSINNLISTRVVLVQ